MSEQTKPRQAIEFSEEQAMMLDTATEYCRTQSPISRVRDLIDADDGFDRAIWQEMVDLGWLGITIPEAYGGLDLGLAEVATIVEPMGRHLLASPYSSTTLAIQTLIHGGTEAQKGAWLPRLAAGEIGTVATVEANGNWNLDSAEAFGIHDRDNVKLGGVKTFVTDAASASIVIATVRIDGKVQLALIERSKIAETALVRETVIDETRRSYRLNLDGITISSDDVLETACLDDIRNAALLLLVAEMAGGLAGVLDVIVEYLTTRKAFDKYIGSFQSLKHPTVDILMGLESARSHLYHVATIIADRSEEVEIALRMAKAQASEAFAFAGDRAVQFHGGFGFTYECDAQLFLRRALWCQYQFGDERHHRKLLADLIL